MHIRISALATLLLGFLLLGGCAGLQHRPAPTIEQVVEMAQSGKSAEDIIAELRLTQAVYALSASRIVGLHDQGVPDQVLDYMQDTYAEHIHWNARMQYERPFYWWHDCFYCYRRHYGPVIIVPR